MRIERYSLFPFRGLADFREKLSDEERGMVLRGFPIVFAAGLLLFCGCEHAPIPEEILVKTAWFQKQLELVHENNNGTISGLLAEQRIIVGKITKRLSNDTFLVCGKTLFHKDSIRFPDAETAAKVKVGEWFAARVQRDPKGRAPLVLEYRELTVNTASPPEEFFRFVKR
jgi:hypothetical protein